MTDPQLAYWARRIDGLAADQPLTVTAEEKAELEGVALLFEVPLPIMVIVDG